MAAPAIMNQWRTLLEQVIFALTMPQVRLGQRLGDQDHSCNLSANVSVKMLFSATILTAGRIAREHKTGKKRTTEMQGRTEPELEPARELGITHPIAPT